LSTEERLAALYAELLRLGLPRAAGLLSRSRVVAAAARGPRNVMAAAFLAPYGRGELQWPPQTSPPIMEVGSRLGELSGGSARHLALVEAIRRLYRQAAMAADRADKEAAQRRDR